MPLYLYFIEPRRAVVTVIKEAILGREGTDVVVKEGGNIFTIGQDLTVSRNHARIVKVEDKYFIEDLGSLNGTRVNGTPLPGWSPKVPSLRVEIKSGDIVELGIQTIFRVGLEKETMEESLRRDHCTIQLLLYSYLQKILIISYKLKESMTQDNLSKLQASLEYVIEKEVFRRIIKGLSEEMLQTIQNHVSIMKSDPHGYLSAHLLDKLIAKIEGIVENVDKEYKTCLSMS